MTEPIDLTDYSFYAVAKVEDLPPGERLFVEIGDVSIVVFNIAGKLFAIGDICTHDDGPLGDGDLDGHQIICPRHGARFDVRNGKVLSLPAVVDIPTYPVRITEDDIEVGVPD
jgi:3-phenylpropionate/trans-cinnamate dioxygenase ferredoxin subunit